jgi:hypothetical protein
MLAVALHCDPEIIAGGLEVRNNFRISTRPKSISGAKCCSFQVRLAAISEGDTGYRGGGLPGCALAIEGLGAFLATGYAP